MQCQMDTACTGRKAGEHVPIVIHELRDTAAWNGNDRVVAPK